MNSLQRFLGPVSGTVPGHVGHRELMRSFLTSSACAGLMAVAVAALQALSDHAPEVFPSNAGLATCVIGLLLDLLRRMDHAAPPARLDAEGPTP